MMSATNNPPSTTIVAPPVRDAEGLADALLGGTTEERPSTYAGLWTHGEARAQEILQLGASACGATAVATVLRQLLPDPPLPAAVLAASICRTRANDAPLPQYLASRAVAGCTLEECILSVQRASAGRLVGEFERGASFPSAGALLARLAALLRSPGVSVIAELNLQLRGNDAWHNQCVYGVDTSARAVFCTNPISEYTAEDFFALCTTPSVLRVRRADVLCRRDRPGGDEAVLQQPAWREMRVAEQLAALDGSGAAHVVIPAAYEGGIAVIRRAPQGGE